MKLEIQDEVKLTNKNGVMINAKDCGHWATGATSMTARSKRAQKSIKNGVMVIVLSRRKTHGKDDFNVPRHGFDYDDID